MNVSMKNIFLFNSPCTKKMTTSEVCSKIQKQVAFYFSDSNYPKDKFLQEEAKKSEEGCKKLCDL